MSIQQNVIAVRVVDEGDARALHRALERSGQVRVAEVPASDGAGWTVAVESHELGPAELRELLEDVPVVCEPHALDVRERLELFAGADPFADQARG